MRNRDQMIDQGLRKDRSCQVINFAHHVTRLRDSAANTKEKDATNLYYHAKRVLDFQNGCAREDDHYWSAGLCICCHRPLADHDDTPDHGPEHDVKPSTRWNPFR